jgi:hypothetical protein
MKRRLSRLRELVDRAGVASEIELRRVGPAEKARRLGSLGSPTVRRLNSGPALDIWLGRAVAGSAEELGLNGRPRQPRRAPGRARRSPRSS